MKALAVIPFVLAMGQASALEVTYGMGEQSFNKEIGFDSSGQLAACAIAENKALQNAVSNYSSRHFVSTEQSVCHNAHCDFIREIDFSENGSVKKIIQTDKKVNDNTCYVKVVAEIEPAEFIPVDVYSKRVYRPGDRLVVDVTIDQPLYLHVWNFHDKGADLIYPIHNHGALIDEYFEFPKGFKAYLREGSKVSKETLVFLFTKKRPHFPTGRLNKSDLKYMLENIPANDRRVITQNIVIRRNYE